LLLIWKRGFVDQSELGNIKSEAFLANQRGEMGWNRKEHAGKFHVSEVEEGCVSDENPATVPLFGHVKPLKPSF
jgi:hypothetical protein